MVDGNTRGVVVLAFLGLACAPDSGGGAGTEQVQQSTLSCFPSCPTLNNTTPQSGWCAAVIGEGGPNNFHGTSSMDAPADPTLPKHFEVTVSGRSRGVQKQKDDGDAEDDQLAFVYTHLQNDSEIVVAVRDLQALPGAQVGVSLRQGTGMTDYAGFGAFGAFTDSDATQHEFQFFRRGSGSDRMQDLAKALTHAVSNADQSSGGALWTMPPATDVWFRVQRIGNDFSVARSKDGATWVPLQFISGGAFAPTASTSGCTGTGPLFGFFLSSGGNATTSAATSAFAHFEVTYAGAVRRDHRSSWVAGTFAAESASRTSKGLHSLYVDPQGRAFKYFDAAENGPGHINMYEDGHVVPVARDFPAFVRQGALTGDAQHVYVAAREDTVCSGPRVVSCSPSSPCRRCNSIKGYDTDLSPATPNVVLDAFNPPIGMIGGIGAGRCVNSVDCRLYVSDIQDGSVRVVSTQSMAVTGSVAFSGVSSLTAGRAPGPLAVDKRGNAWVIAAAGDYGLDGNPLTDEPLFRPVPGNAVWSHPALVQYITPSGGNCGSITGPTPNADVLKNCTSSGLMIPTAIAVDPDPNKDRLLIADNGCSQNIRIYNLVDSQGQTTATLAATFGESQGVYSGTRGLANDPAHGNFARFYSPTGVGMDGNGNIYVTSGIDVDVRKFTRTSDLVWNQTQATTKTVLGFANSYGGYVDFDPTSDGHNVDVFSARERFSFNLDGDVSGTEWSLGGITWDPFRYPELDENTNTRRHGGMPMVQRINGKRFLYVLGESADPRVPLSHSSGMKWLTVYRFVDGIAVPTAAIGRRAWCGQYANEECDPNDNTCVECRNSANCVCNTLLTDGEDHDGNLAEFSVITLWVDADGDGQMEENEVAPPTDFPEAGFSEDTGTLTTRLWGANQGGTWAGYPANDRTPFRSDISGFDVDTEGNLWLVFASTDPGGREIWKLDCTNCGGDPMTFTAPQYSLEYHHGDPIGPTSKRKIFLPPPAPAGYVRAPGDVKYDAANHALYLLGTQWVVLDAQGHLGDYTYYLTRINCVPNCDQAPAWDRVLATITDDTDFTFAGPKAEYQSFDIAGDKIFVDAGWSSVRIFDSASGNLRPERLYPGPEISGLVSDTNKPGLRATKILTGSHAGEYLVAIPDNSVSDARTRVYRWNPTSTPGCSSNSDCQANQFCGNGTCQTRPCSLNGTFGAISSVFPSSVTASGFALSQDGLTAYVSSKASQTHYDLYKATRSSTSEAFGTLTSAGNVNTSDNERSPWLSRDGLRLFFWRVATVNSNLYQATRASTSVPFDTAVALTSINSSNADEDPFFDWNEQTLYFVSDRPGGDRGFFSTTLSGGTYSTPTRISALESYTEEHHPVIARNSLRIYFGSEYDSPTGDTNGDIWMAERTSTGGTFGTWSNLASLNTSGREDPLLLSPDECTLYFMSNRDTGSNGTQTYRVYQATRASSP